MHRPDDPRSAFGEMVEATAGSTGVQLTRFCTEVVTRAMPEILERLTDHMTAQIEQRFAMIENRQRVNLNVRAPKRDGPYTPAITRHVAGHPYPVAKFLDEMEKQDPTWKSIRRSYAPTFSMQVQVLKKRQLKGQGQLDIFVEQNHRPQLYYTIQDRPLMEEAWALTEAHREDLAGRPGVQSHLPSERPSVLALLQRV